jgi:DNA-binding NarL/FixJ family response regulator
MIGSVFDITDERRAEREIAAHVAVAHALAEWESLDQGAELLLRNLADAIGFEVGVLWLPADDVLVPRVLWHSAAVDVAAFEAATWACRLRAGTGLTGRVWRDREPTNRLSVADDRTFLRREAAVQVGLRGAIAFPALHAEEVLAVLEFFSYDEAPLPERLVRSLTGIGYEIGHFLAGRRGELGAAALSARELEVLQLAAQGLTVRQIAERLRLSRATVKTHLEHIYEKLEVSDRASAVASGLRLGLIE